MTWDEKSQIKYPIKKNMMIDKVSLQPSTKGSFPQGIKKEDAIVYVFYFEIFLRSFSICMVFEKSLV